MGDVMVPYVVRNVDGTEVKFGKLSPRDRAEILRRLKDERRGRFLAAMEKGGVTGSQYVNEVDAFDQMIIGVDELVRYLNSPIGQDEVIGLACKKQNGDNAQAILDKLTLDHQDTTSMAFELAGIKVVFVQPAAQPSADAQEKQDAQPRPSAPASSSQ